MNNQFDELAKGMAQSVTRRRALKKFGVGLAGMVLACFGLANRTQAKNSGCIPSGHTCDPTNPGQCCSGICQGTLKGSGGKVGPPFKCE
jgi:hypothetical protein